jgi:Flp pilus assembly protein TadD
MVALVATSGAFASRPARAQAPTALDSAPLLTVAAVRAREAAIRIESRSAPAARAPSRGPAATQYAAGLALLGQSQFDSAAVLFKAATTASPDIARYRGDLAFTLAASGHFSDAEEQYRAAVRLQQANPWYYVGLGVAQVAQQHWTQAAASFTLAVASDSAVIIRQLIAPVGNAYEQTNQAQALDDWSKMATVRFPDEPSGWLRLASADFQRHDTAAGFPAIRRYRVLKPDDRVGALLYAEFLYASGQNDSAAALAMQASPDTSLRRLASIILYNAGGNLVQASKFDSAAHVLQEGRDIATEADQPRFELLLGIARLRLLQPLYNEAAQHSDCHKAPVADSMITDVIHLETAGVAADSAMANQVLRAAAQYRTAIDAFVKQCGRH